MASTTTSRSAQEAIEISVKGKWSTIPSLRIGDKNICVKGHRVRMAIVNSEEWLETEVMDPEECIRALKDQKSGPLHADIFTFVQKLPDTARKYDYPMEWHSVAVAHVASFKNWWDALPQVTRKNVRRAEKRGVVVQVKDLNDQLVSEIMGVNNDSPVRQNIPFAHYGKSFEQVKKDQSSYHGRCDFLCAYAEDRLIGFIKLVYRGNVASILQILPRASEQDRRPANALIAKAVEVCAEKGISYLTYGMFNYGNKGDSSLREFKSRNGFAEMLVPRYYIPLTWWGALCVKMKLHRGLMGILPHRAISAGVSMRAAWYNLVHKQRPV